MTLYTILDTNNKWCFLGEEVWKDRKHNTLRNKKNLVIKKYIPYESEEKTKQLLSIARSFCVFDLYGIFGVFVPIGSEARDVGGKRKKIVFGVVPYVQGILLSELQYENRSDIFYKNIHRAADVFISQLLTTHRYGYIFGNNRPENWIYDDDKGQFFRVDLECEALPWAENDGSDEYSPLCYRDSARWEATKRELQNKEKIIQYRQAVALYESIRILQRFLKKRRIPLASSVSLFLDSFVSKTAVEVLTYYDRVASFFLSEADGRAASFP